MKKIKILFCLLSLIFVFLCLPIRSAAETKDSYISNTKDFLNALKKGTEVIYVDDISFEKETNIVLNYDVQIVGKKEKSRIENAYFTITGSVVSGESVSINIENIIFDGMIKKEDFPFDREGLTFDQMFGEDWGDKHCFTANWGYFDLTLTGCDVTRYANLEGPVLYLENSDFTESNQIVNLTDCSFYENLCYEGTIKMWHDKGIYNINQCRFYNNTAKSAAGMILSNGKVRINDTSVTDNVFYRFLKEKYPNDLNYVKRLNKEFPYYNSCGAVFIGAADALVKNCTISGNCSVFGGAIGIVSPEAVPHGEKVEIVDCTISNNSAVLGGGALFICSYTGQTIRFINCMITGNSAPKGGILYTTVLAPYMRDTMGGTTEFLFCTMAENTDNDGGSFGYYDLLDENMAGNIELYGCFVIDNAKNPEGSDNYVATRKQAIEDGAVTETDLENIGEEGLRPAAGSAADITVAPEVYSLWDTSFADSKDARPIGAILDDDSGSKTMVWIIVGAAVVVILIVLFIIFRGKRKKKQEAALRDSGNGDAPASQTESNQMTAETGPLLKTESTDASDKDPAMGAKSAVEPKDYSGWSQEELIELVSKAFADKGMTKKEIQDAALLLVCEKRRDIADQLFVSEDTVKTHLSHIFKKTGVSSRQEFHQKVDEGKK